MGTNDRNFKWVRNWFMLASFLCLTAQFFVRTEPGNRICWTLVVVFGFASLVQIILFRIKPEWFKDKTPYDERPGSVKRQSDPPAGRSGGEK